MDRLMAGRTAVIIAHRLSTVRAMDRILVFERGRIIEEGDHETLLRRPQGHYRQLFDRQSGALLTPEVNDAKFDDARFEDPEFVE
jgi:ATP-binding cassette subfamily B protein